VVKLGLRLEPSEMRVSGFYKPFLASVPSPASARAASIGDGHQFKNGRELTAWLGLTPANKSRGGKERLGRVTKMGDQYLRHLLVVGATSLVRQVRYHPERANKWLTGLLDRKPARLATVAILA
jgi:transposase